MITLNFQHLVLLAVLGTAIHWLGARASITRWFWDLRWWPGPKCEKCHQHYHRYLNMDNELEWHHNCGGPVWGTPHQGLHELLKSTVEGLLACAACAGWWLGLGLGLLGIRPVVSGHGWLNVICAGLVGIVVVPIVEGALIWGLRATRIE